MEEVGAEGGAMHNPLWTVLRDHRNKLKATRNYYSWRFAMDDTFMIALTNEHLATYTS